MQKFLAALFILYLVASPIVIGVSIYKWVHYKSLAGEYKTQCVFLEMDKLVEEAFKDIPTKSATAAPVK